MEEEGFPGSFLEPRCLWPAIKIDWEPFGDLELSEEEGWGPQRPLTRSESTG